MSDLHVVILAAGKSTRMKSALPKVLHRVAGRSMIDRVLATARALAPTSTTVVVARGGGHLQQVVQSIPGVAVAYQEPQLGTGHALLQAEPLLKGASGTLLLLSGDVPRLSATTLERLRREHEARGAAMTVLTARLDRPYGYGRIIRSRGALSRIVEERDATDAQRKIPEVNSGIYAFALGPLFDALRAIAAENAQGEYYLPDLVGIYRRRRLRVGTVEVSDAREIRGINSRSELADVTMLIRQTKNEELMAAGVTIEDPAATYIDDTVQVGPDTVIHPNVYLEGQTTIGAASEIHSGVRIVDSAIGERVTILNFCVLEGARVASGARIGPFAHLRSGSDVREDAKVGNFVELKQTVLGRRSKANHLTYLGDAVVGEDVNVGAGTITCNYDGVRKHPTIIEDGAFIGSDTQLVAPVRVGRGAYVAAGSSITEDVPPESLGIARSRQTNIAGWVARRAERADRPAPDTAPAANRDRSGA